MKPSILDLLQQRPVLLDGAMSPVFSRLQFPEGHHTGEWNLSHPDRVQQVHKTYWEAGSDAVATNTWSSNRLQLRNYGHGLEAKHDQITRNAVILANEICPPDKYVFGDLGPTGKMLAPYDDTPVEVAEQIYNEQAALMVDEGVDFLVFETFFNLTEAIAAVRGARQASSTIPIVVMCTFKYLAKQNGWYTIMGQSISDFFTAIHQAGANIVGENCMPSTDLKEIASKLRKATTAPLCIRPNAGIPHVKEGHGEHPIGPDEFASHLVTAQAHGIQLLGGCCGTTPEPIQTLRHRLIGDIPSISND